MDFTQYILTPLNTTEQQPLITIIKLTKGRLTGGSLYFPSGPAGKLHFLARIGTHQIIPFNASQNIHLDDCIFPLSLGADLDQPPYELICQTWNDSTLYDHALTLCLHLDPIIDKQNDLKRIMRKLWYFTQ